MPLEVTPLPGYLLLGRTPDQTVVLQSCPRFRVLDIACDYSCEYTPEDIMAQYPFLSLAEIHQAMWESFADVRLCRYGLSDYSIEEDPVLDELDG